MEDGTRERLLEAMLRGLAESGYAELPVAEVVAEAGVSEAEFKAEFGGKDGCLFAAYDHLTERLVEQATADCDSADTWPQRIRAGLSALLGEIAAEPEMARVATRTFPAIRPAAYERYVELLSRFVPFMEEGREYSEVAEKLPGEVELLAVGAAEAIVFAEVDAGRAQRLPAMMPEILFSVLVPFIGPDRAAEEMRSASPAR